jgi:hypothetical protein
MEHTALLARLEAARRKAKLGQDQIDQQRMIIARLFSAGADTTEAENRLRVYEKLHDRYLGDIERILDALETPPDINPSDERRPARLPAFQPMQASRR